MAAKETRGPAEQRWDQERRSWEGRRGQNATGNTIWEASYAGMKEVLRWDGHAEIGIVKQNHLRFSRFYY